MEAANAGAFSVNDSTANDAGAPTSPLALATTWQAALRDRNLPRLIALATYPFALRDTGASVSCTEGTASKAPELDALLSCLIKDELLGERGGAVDCGPALRS